MDDSYLYGDEDDGGFAFARPAGDRIEEVGEGEEFSDEEEYGRGEEGEEEEEDAAGQGFFQWLRTSFRRKTVAGTLSRASKRTKVYALKYTKVALYYGVTLGVAVVLPLMMLESSRQQTMHRRAVCDIATGRATDVGTSAAMDEIIAAEQHQAQMELMAKAQEQDAQQQHQQ